MKNSVTIELKQIQEVHKNEKYLQELINKLEGISSGGCYIATARQDVVSLFLGFVKWLEFCLGDKWCGFFAESKQKCLSRIVGDTRIGEF